MAELREERGSGSAVLLAEHLIGRGPQCALRLDARYVSSQHAVIRWSGNGWELIDRGSRNGTQLNGATVEAGRAYRLTKGAVLTFGHPDERWTLADSSEPQTMVLALDSGEVRLEHFGMIGIPSNESPQVTLFKDLDGAWKLEDTDGAVSDVPNGKIFESSGRSYLFSTPTSSELTVSVGTALISGAPVLRFSVSSDEDFVELSLKYESRSVSLGSRAHNYLLLTLARRRLADARAGVDDATRGWMDKGELAAGLRMSPELLEGEILRIRKHFAAHGYPDARGIIGRRKGTGLLRLGVDKIEIVRG